MTWRLMSLMLTVMLLFASAFAGALALAPTYRAALPGYRYHFPADHASHPAFKTEWWYYTGHLKARNGRPFGFELTFFRSGIPLKHRPKGAWALKDVYPAHFAITDEAGKRFYFTERLGRSGLGLADAETSQYNVRNGNWFVRQTGPKTFALHAKSPEYGLTLNLRLAKPPAVHGQNGVSQKAACKGCASHYYSLTRLQASGNLVAQGKRLPVTGNSWMDHEFGSNQLASGQVGWDWFSLQMNDGTDWMLYRMRLKDGTIDPQSSGSLVDRAGHVTHLLGSGYSVQTLAWWRSPQGARYPAKWRVRVPSKGLDVVVTPVMANQELSTMGTGGIRYWEGRSLVRGRHGKARVSGEAYVELTGYVRAFTQRI